MAIKNISVGDAHFNLETSISSNEGFLLTLSSFRQGNKKDVSEIYVDLETANQIADTIKESIKFAKTLKSVVGSQTGGD